jgi:hypothetical protein
MRQLVRLTGFEPVTVRLEGGCSIQLSYRRYGGSEYQAYLRKSKSTSVFNHFVPTRGN